MYARVLRKWSLTKVLMYLWLLPVLMLLVIYCQNATTMHLNGIINTKLSSSILSSSSPESVSKIIIKKPATLLSSTIQKDDINSNKKNILTPIDNIIINDDQYYYDNDDYQHDILEEQQQKNKFIKPLNNKNGYKSIISNYNDADDNYHQINQKTTKPLLIAENSAPILITVQTVSNADSVSISDTNNASAKVPNLNSQIINLNNYNNINNNNNNNSNNNIKYNSLTSSANIDTISSNNNNNNNLNNRSNKFRRHIQQSRILSVNDNIQQEESAAISSTFQQENLLNAQAQHQNILQQQSPPPYLSDQLHQNTNSQNLHSDRSKLINNNNDQISSFNKNHQHQQNNDDNNHELPQIFDQLSSPQQERFYELRERRTRIEAHRRRLMRLNQLRSTQSSTSSTQIMLKKNNSDIEYNQLLIPTEATTTYNNIEQSSSDIQKDIDSNRSVVELNKLLAGRNRRDSRPHPLHLSSVPSSIQPLYSHQSGLGSSSMTMLTVPSVQPSYSSYPAVQSTGYYRQSPPLYQHYNTNNNYNNMNNYNHLNQQQHHNHQQYNNNNQQQQHQQQHQQQQQQRKRPRRYCSARDPAQLAFEAPTVFEGKIISMSYDRRANFSVTFEVKEIFKKQIGYMLPNLLRLQFTYRNTSGECDIYREYLRPRGLVRGNELEQGRVYILFVQQIDLGNYTILGQPVRKTRRAVNSVRKGVSENYAQAAFIRSLTAIANDKRIDNDKRIKNGEELRIICRVSGQPPPKVTWFKDDKSINRNRKLYQFVHLKKRSELIIRSFNSTDAGVYECRAKNKNSRKPERKIIRIESFPRITYESSSQQSGDECTHDMQIYCLNGGTCKYFKEIHDFSCECPDGFYGDRCQEKQWNETPNPTFKTGYMADDPTVLDSDEESVINEDETI